jgi:hypothetical protein
MTRTRTPPKEGKDAAQRSGTGGALSQHQNNMQRSAREHMRAPFRHSAPRTSREAAQRIESPAPKSRERILGFLIERSKLGATDEEGESALGIKSQSYTPRRRELVKQRVVVDSGERRLTESGRSAVVWVVQSGRSVGKPL